MAHFVVCATLIVCFVLSASAVNFQRTIVTISKTTAFGENIFIRGESSKGSIRIRHELKTHDQGFYAMMSTGDRYLSWGGAEQTQWKYLGYIDAQGTPMMHTTNDHTIDERVHRNGSSLLDHIGDELWLADFYMDCDQTDDGWFQFKGYMTDLREGHYDYGWEGDFFTSTCTVDDRDVGLPNAGYTNHNAKCGYFNTAIWESDFCHSYKLDYSMMLFRLAWQETRIV